ncbi:hypothetical protein AGMMS50293_20270 [Spirochaetia bacterium]|nr:hypothetical protein AGMMS50293_20270 [Spirochaetia bacterium]
MSSGTKLNLILGSHAHVPSGAAEFENVYEKKLRPFVSNLYKYPKIQAALHYSGVLLHWVERIHPELFMLIEDMVSRRQVEMLGGGFYEPILPLIPMQDRIGQIELLTTYLRRNFGKRPQGCWISAMAWEQHLAASLVSCGMAYTFLSEKQFLLAGLSGEDLLYPCISEDQGKLITVFPVSQSADAVLAKSNAGGRIISVFPEQLSAAPGETPDYAWNRFFEELSLSEDLVECVTPGKILRTCKNLKKAAFPDSTGPDCAVSPRHFLIEHPEANGIYSKMIFTNVLINQLRGDKSRKLSAREELWKAQDSGLFVSAENQIGHTLRKAAYRSLLGAERITREKEKFVPSLVQYDFDLDGAEEYLFQDAKINCYIQITGAGIFELDYLPKTWNYLDAGAAGKTGCRRTAFTDILLPGGTKAEDLPRLCDQAGVSTEPRLARFCVTEKYDVIAHDRSKGKVCFTLPAAAVSLGNIEIEKCFSLKKDILTVRYSLRNAGKEKEDFCFVPEIYLSFAGEGEEFVRFFICKNGEKDTPAGVPLIGEAVFCGVDGLKIQDLKNEVQINFASTKAFDGCAGSARMGEFYQSSRIMPLFALSLAGSETWANEFSLKFSH